VLTNLLSYAHEHTPKKGQIRVRAWLEGEYVHCAVSDTGTSLPSEDQARLFTKSIHSDDSAIQEIPGMGLGLCIAKSLIVLHGGEVKVESHPGEGTTFAFTVPIATGKQAGRGAKRAGPTAFTTPSALETWHGRKTDFSFTTPSALETWHGRHKGFAFTTPADLETWHGRKKRVAFTVPAVADD
jgi:anti-sigma regulatory factor (Ser/Thr protein kinase)